MLQALAPIVARVVPAGVLVVAVDLILVNGTFIRVMGDIPIYVAADSADAWSHPELFELDEELAPRRIAGVPPDYFSVQSPHCCTSGRSFSST